MMESVVSDATHELEEIRDIMTCAICLELYENARLLPCSHSFCLNCLRALCDEGIHNEHTPCPQCRKQSVPPPALLDELPSHDFANRLADLVREQDGLLDVEEEDGCGDIYTGDLLPSSARTEQKAKKSKGSKVMLAMLKGVATVASLGIGGIYLGMRAAKRKRMKRRDMAQNPLQSFTCDACHKLQDYSESELRYKCGMCEDFNLCHSCASGSLTRVHRPDHMLVKLKFRQKRYLPPGCLLKYRKARDMSEEIDFSTSLHSRAYYHTPEKLEWVDAISCSFCGQSPIVGTRYKCGMCKDYDLCESCEEHSHQVHDRDHVFLVLKNKVKVNIVSEPLMKALVY